VRGCGAFDFGDVLRGELEFPGTPSACLAFRAPTMAPVTAGNRSVQAMATSPGLIPVFIAPEDDLQHVRVDRDSFDNSLEEFANRLNAINTVLTFPRLFANRTYRRHENRAESEGCPVLYVATTTTLRSSEESIVALLIAIIVACHQESS
jgi:hypothetical protein